LPAKIKKIVGDYGVKANRTTAERTVEAEKRGFPPYYRGFLHPPISRKVFLPWG